jgi:hypothetical protein
MREGHPVMPTQSGHIQLLCRIQFGCRLDGRSLNLYFKRIFFIFLAHTFFIK